MNDNLIHGQPKLLDVYTDIVYREELQNIEDIESRVKNQGNNNCFWRLLRLAYCAALPIITLILLSGKQRNEPNGKSFSFIIGIGLLLMFGVYYVMIAVFVCGPLCCKRGTLYRIYSISGTLTGWAKLDIGAGQLLYKNDSIESISELSAIHGAIPKVMLHTLGAYTWVAVVLHYAGQLLFKPIYKSDENNSSCFILNKKSKFSWDIADIFAVLGAGGLLVISIFELDPFNRCMCKMHYVGAVGGAFCIVAFVVQQCSIDATSGEKGGILFAGVIISVGVVAFFVWHLKLFNWCINGGRVTHSSACSIGWEALTLFTGALSLCLFLIYYDLYPCKTGCGMKP